MAGAGCSPPGNTLQDGYYSAVAASFDEAGWKDFITLYVYNNKILTAEYNARNASGLILSWDGFSMRKMATAPYIHPNRIIREYTHQLINGQDPSRIQRVQGDSHFYDAFKTLAAVAIERARTGDKTVAEVDIAKTSVGSQ